MDKQKFDVIIIGSGMGGLTTGSLLAQFGGKRVLIVERHFKLGGFTHSFRRKKYEWDVGVHYIGEMQPGSMTRGIMDLVTQGGVQWHRMSSSYERFMFPGETFEVPESAELFQKKLIERFPSEESNIKRYFRDVRRAKSWVARWFVSKQYSPFLGNLLTSFGKSLVGMTTNEYLSKFKDPLLKAILTAQWLDFGTSPANSAFGFHATVTADFFNGAFYPVGGAKQIATCAVAAIEEHGGECLVSREVTKILVRDGKAYGIVARHKDEDIEYLAPVIISNAGAMTTFGKLTPEGLCLKEHEKLSRLKPGMSANVLYIGLNDDPRKHGFDDSNYWMYSHLDHELHAKQNEGDPSRIHGGFVSFGSLRNPGQEPHTAQMICFSEETEWKKYADSNWKRRGEDYEQAKSEIADAMLDYADTRMPGFRNLVSYYELSTPLSVKSFTGHWAGTIYGQACDANRLFRDSWSIGTSIKNLYLTGSDVGTPGINGAMMAGVMTAAKLLGPLGLPRIFVKAMSKRTPH